MRETEPYLEQFDLFEKAAKQPSWVFPLRKAGIARFAELGFPTAKHEDWRFTNVARIAKLPFKPVREVLPEGLNQEVIAQLTFGGLAASRLVFLNGHYVAGLSLVRPQVPGVVISSLAEALLRNPG